MNARLRKKYLRNAERLFAEACRLYKTRPRGESVDGKIQELADSILSLNLMLTFHSWSRHGPSHLRQMSVLDVKVDTVEEHEEHVVLGGSVRWSRRHAGKETELTERFRIECAVPSPRKTPKWVRPAIVLKVSDGGAA
jgi:hypothetical protein